MKKVTATLSQREETVVEKISEGKTKKEIANELNLSVRTVENHTRKAFIKTGCRKSTELTTWWLTTAKNKAV